MSPDEYVGRFRHEIVFGLFYTQDYGDERINEWGWRVVELCRDPEVSDSLRRRYPTEDEIAAQDEAARREWG
jgi:hypothetical protein